MSLPLKLVNVVVFVFLVIKATFGPMFDAFFILPKEYQPKLMIDIRSFYVSKYGDYFVEEKPNFYVGFAWLELCVLWPLSLANLFGLIFGKSWFKTTCLIHGVCLTTMMVAIISEILGSDKETEDLKKVYFLFMGLCTTVTLRGLYSSFCETSTPTIGTGSLSETMKKKA